MGARTGKPAAKAQPGKWTKAKEEIFFQELAMVCNVTAALRKVGMLRASSKVYERRKRDPAFRASWQEAVGESYAMLELEMLERQRAGANRPAPATKAEERLREIPTALGLQLLRLHQSQVKARPPSAQRPMRGAKLRDELEKRLSEISRRLGGAG
ncbi:MAG TPA: hypothetical protein VGW34_05220 [Allosphingosinicella sp.]|nr:hypothetical protein [Allosphingosinicella sp.]